MNPFDLKTALFAKHAQHVAIVHFPIALLLVSFLFDLLALWRRSPALAVAARYNLFFAAVSSLFAVGTGLAAWQWLLGGGRLAGMLRLHLALALVSVVMTIGLWSWRRGRLDHAQVMGWRYLSLAFFACVFIALTGHLGGFVSGVNRPGD